MFDIVLCTKCVYPEIAFLAGATGSMTKVFFVTLTASVFLQHWHLMMMSACSSLPDESFASERDLAESQALLLQTGH